MAWITEHPLGDGCELLVVVSQWEGVTASGYGVIFKVFFAFLPHMRKTVYAGNVRFEDK